jgi:hypothetical protein
MSRSTKVYREVKLVSLQWAVGQRHSLYPRQGGQSTVLSEVRVDCPSQTGPGEPGQGGWPAGSSPPGAALQRAP